MIHYPRNYMIYQQLYLSSKFEESRPILRYRSITKDKKFEKDFVKINEHTEKIK